MKDDSVLPILTASLVRFSLKGWENVLFELGSERVQAIAAVVRLASQGSANAALRMHAGNSFFPRFWPQWLFANTHESVDRLSEEKTIHPLLKVCLIYSIVPPKNANSFTNACRSLSIRTGNGDDNAGGDWTDCSRKKRSAWICEWSRASWLTCRRLQMIA